MSSSLALADFSTCEISDALLKLGVPHGGHIPDLARFSPTPSSDTAPPRLCGPAYTVRMVLVSDTDAPRLQGHFVDCIPDGSVAFIAAPSNAQSAVWGGLMTLGALARGCRGTVVYGRARDLSEHRSLGYPLFALGTSTVGQAPFTRASEVQVPVIVNVTESGLPQVEVRPGDLLVGDEDGVVCVPRELEGEVVERAKRGREVDARCAEDIKKGVGVAESFRRHRGTKL
ncbi:RraA-like protein [Vararia minispora EC-137]|uniref:RraA-like protein n=1 Tax=Vararia minispora EC-137 TaxID=1314806 RepID=A0ACB8QGP8_9AGAM|nr:RraA-like protein [Vararia minispora EC-137]